MRSKITIVPVEDVREVLLQALCETPGARRVQPAAKEEGPLTAQVMPDAAQSAAGLHA